LCTRAKCESVGPPLVYKTRPSALLSRSDDPSASPSSMRTAAVAGVPAAKAGSRRRTGVEFIDENGGGSGVRPRKREHKKG
jgi:hypothetical protein